MALSKLINLLALSSLAILACSFLASPVNALSIDTLSYVRRDHAAIAKKRSTSTSTKRCKPRPALSNSTTTTVSTPKPSPAKNVTPSPKPSPVKNVTPSPKASPVAAAVSAPPQPKSSPSNSTSGSGGKRCIGWSSGDDPSLAKWAHGKADKLYTWSAYLPSNTYGLLGMPMLWGPAKLAEFQTLVLNGPSTGSSTIVLGYNEPDIPSQSHMSPEDAAQHWQQYMNPLKDKGYTLVSPATVTGTKWLTDFFKACNGHCIVDIVATHWYGTDHTELETYLESFHTQFNMPVWLTEVACQSFGNQPQCNDGQVWELMNALKAYESNPWFETWCWFGAMHDMTNVNYLNQLMAPNGAPNSLGNDFLY